MHGLAQMYKYGRGVSKDYKKVFELLEMSVKQGNSFAMNYIGLEYWEGICCNKNYSKAVEYFKMAAQKGNVPGMRNLAHLYQYGDEFEQNYDESVKFIGMAIQFSNSQSLALNLARLYNANIVVDRNLIVKHLVTYCENTKQIDMYINLDKYDIVWETYLHKFWPTKNTIKNKIYVLLLISKNRNVSKIDMKWMVKGITMIIIKYLATFEKNEIAIVK